MENPLELENVGEIQKKGGQARIQDLEVLLWKTSADFTFC